MTQPLKLCRIVMAPAPTGPGAFNRIVSVVLEEDQDVIWEWTRSPNGAEFVSGYTIVPRLSLLELLRQERQPFTGPPR